MDMDSVGNKFFNILLESSLLQAVQRDRYGNVSYCSMHDLVHDLACSVLNPKTIRLNNDIFDDIYQNRYVGREYIRDESCPIPKEQARCLRTLFFIGKVSDIMLLEFKSLHVLILMGRDFSELPSSIRELIHLRYLDISYTRIECLPDSIGELYHLKTLRAVAEDQSEYFLTKLPNTLKYLISLMHLHIPNIQLPPDMGRLTSLQTLPYFKVGPEKGYGIIELRTMKSVKGKVEIHGLENVHGKEEAMSADFSQKRNIFKLKFVWDESREGETNDEHVLEGLQPHPNLKSLEIYGFKGKSFPLWTLKMEIRDDIESRWVGLSNLIEIRLTNCKECEEIPMLGHLPRLEYLYLCGLTNVRSIGSSFYGIEGCSKETINVFPALKSLEFTDMPNLTLWAELEISKSQLYEVVVFPCLEYMKVENCNRLMSAPSHFPCLKELEIFGMESGVPLENICGGIKLISLTKLKIERLDGLVCLPNGLFNNNRNFSHLEIRDCPNLTHLASSLRGAEDSLGEVLISNCSSLMELPYDLHVLNSLKKLSIYLCPNLKSIPYPSDGRSKGFASLRHFEIGGCKGLTDFPCEILESCGPSLEKLSLFGLISLTNLSILIGRLYKLPHLTSLSIFDVPKCNNFVKAIGSLCNLRDLSIGYSADSWNYNSFKETVDGIVRIGGLKSLRRLSLNGIEYWGSLPDELQNLTSLSLLAIYGFGIKELPEWFGNLSSLEVLYLYGCQKLRSLPSKDAMRRLPKLTELHIIDCPLLKEKCVEQERDDDSEWPKISHIPQVFM
ncbi:putative disease resistance protein rga3 [Phtheirospermum japonicum]|uniref:Putative disease resistance protein rga3 n=1 Tax=Phtheirospermum japonicum TaxID=374723 RepID=A0A830BDD4_9LAMI|nr:putative disease resistance protein rga3 [Phtheirospermum japonicum]